jgi:penicillin-binding protein 2
MRRTSRTEQPRVRRSRRSRAARVVLSIVLAWLVLALVRLQLLGGEQYALIAKENRLRPLVVRAPRGTIYDRHGNVVAENSVGYQVMVMPSHPDSMKKVVDKLAPVLGLTEADIKIAQRRFRRDPHLPMVVTSNASQVAIARLEEHRTSFPGVLVYEYPVRRYPAGSSVAHLVGYVSEISESEMAQPRWQGYEQGRWIGKQGLERRYERMLGGQPGMRYLEIDARGRIKRWLPEQMGVPPVPGKDLHLYLDLDLQRYVMELFRELAAQHNWDQGTQAGFVAIDPKTGGVLAYYSSPAYEPNLFTGGIATKPWNALNTSKAKPLLDRAGGAAQPPGSTFKLMVAAMALDLGVIKPEEYMPISCTGGMGFMGHYARCHGVHGRQNLRLGIMNSCDVYFYQVGIRIGLKRFLQEGTRLGFADKTGIDLSSEAASIFPKDTEWWKKRFGYKPYENEIMSLSIGQGAVTITPLKLAHMFVALARKDGKAPAPRIAQTDSAAPITFRLPITPEQIELLRDGMRRVVAPPGTAALSRLPYWDFMGKTGTAQNAHGDDHSWFVGLGGPPGKEPEIVAAMLIYGGEHGYVASGPVANAINFYLNRKYGRQFERYPTPRERLPRGMDVNWDWYMSPVGPGGVTPPPQPRPKPVAKPESDEPRVLGTPVPPPSQR